MQFQSATETSDKQGITWHLQKDKQKDWYDIVIEGLKH
jgi:hypothetical protein